MNGYQNYLVYREAVRNSTPYRLELRGQSDMNAKLRSLAADEARRQEASMRGAFGRAQWEFANAGRLIRVYARPEPCEVGKGRCRELG